MGCGSSAPAKGAGSGGASGPGAPAKKPLTFGKDPNLNVKDFTAAGVEDGVFVRVPGTVNGQSFQVNGCKRSSILILDHASQVTIDNCEDCRVVVAACSASVFVRNCTRCDMVLGCQQLRTRDCSKVRVSLLCKSRPIIEASTGMQFGPFSLNYWMLPTHLDAAGLSPWTNRWSEVYDFSCRSGKSPNWTDLQGEVDVRFGEALITEAGIVPDGGPVPYSYGVSRPRPRGDESVVLVVLQPEVHGAAARTIVDAFAARAFEGKGVEGWRLDNTLPLLLRSRLFPSAAPLAQDQPPAVATLIKKGGAGECLVLHFGGVGARAAVGAAVASSPLAGSAFLVAGGATTSALEKCFEATDEG